VSFTVFPAIDLRQGRVVRLRQGDPAAQTVYGEDPAAVARAWAAQGAEWLHVVNLDGALTPQPPLRPLSVPPNFGGEGEITLASQPPLRPPLAPSNFGGEGSEGEVNLRRLAEIRAAVAIPIQFGGGLRDVADIARVLELGATRVVLGTVAVRRPEVVAQALARFGPERIVVGLDARDGWVAVHGWRETSALDVLTVARRMRDLGVRRVVYTDIARDGTLTGVNLEATVALARGSGLRVIASGGVASLDDIRRLAAHAADGIEGVIVGQALYTGAIILKDALNL